MEKRLEKLTDQQRMRMWLMEHFRVLPTDDRYRALSDEQIELLFVSFLRMPSDDFLRKEYYTELTAKQVEVPATSLKTLGYNDVDIEKIKQDLQRRQGADSV